MKIGTGEKLVSVVLTVLMCPGLERLVFWVFVLFCFPFQFLTAPWAMRDLSSLITDQARASCIETPSLNCQITPCMAQPHQGCCITCGCLSKSLQIPQLNTTHVEHLTLPKVRGVVWFHSGDSRGFCVFAFPVAHGHIPQASQLATSLVSAPSSLVTCPSSVFSLHHASASQETFGCIEPPTTPQSRGCTYILRSANPQP